MFRRYLLDERENHEKIVGRKTNGLFHSVVLFMSWQVFDIEPLNILKHIVSNCELSNPFPIYTFSNSTLCVPNMYIYVHMCTFISPRVLVLNSVFAGTFGIIYNRT